MIPAQTPSTNLTRVDNPNQMARIIDAISEIDYDELLDKSVGDSIESLSTNTVFESIEVAPEGIFKRNENDFEASAIIYVTLNYGGKKDRVSMPDSYPVTIRGTLSNDTALVTAISVDTSSFYE